MIELNHARYLVVIVTLHVQTLSQVFNSVRVFWNDFALGQGTTGYRDFSHHRTAVWNSDRIVPRKRAVI